MTHETQKKTTMPLRLSDLHARLVLSTVLLSIALIAALTLGGVSLGLVVNRSDPNTPVLKSLVSVLNISLATEESTLQDNVAAIIQIVGTLNSTNAQLAQTQNSTNIQLAQMQTLINVLNVTVYGLLSPDEDSIPLAPIVYLQGNRTTFNLASNSTGTTFIIQCTGSNITLPSTPGYQCRFTVNQAADGAGGNSNYILTSGSASLSGAIASSSTNTFSYPHVTETIIQVPCSNTTIGDFVDVEVLSSTLVLANGIVRTQGFNFFNEC